MSDKDKDKKVNVKVNRFQTAVDILRGLLEFILIVKKRWVDPTGAVKGHLQITTVNTKTGERKLCVDDSNIIVDNFKTQVAHLIVGDDTANRIINRIQFGTSNTPAESTSDTALVAPITPIKTVSSTSFPTTTSVTLTFVLDESEASGFPLREAGLLFSGVSPALAARRTFDEINKTADIIVEVQWTLSW